MSNNFPAVRAQIMSPTVQKMVSERLGEKMARPFIASVLSLIGSDKDLSECNPLEIIGEAMKAASLNLPISKQLGFAYVIPYGKKPQFQIGYKGYIQLAIRSGVYKRLNAGIIYEGQRVEEDLFSGDVSVSGEPTSSKAVAYFAYMELVSGFQKIIMWRKEKVIEHAMTYSKSFKKSGSVWKTNFDQMAKKTVILQLKPYMPMTIECDMARAIEMERTEDGLYIPKAEEGVYAPPNHANANIDDSDMQEKCEEWELVDADFVPEENDPGF